MVARMRRFLRERDMWAWFSATTTSKVSVLALAISRTTSSLSFPVNIFSTRRYSLIVSRASADASSLSEMAANAADAAVSGLPEKPARMLSRASFASTSSSAPAVSRTPSKVVIFLTLEGSFNSRLAIRSPAEITDPGERVWVIFPLSLALIGMIIFMASTSTYGSPTLTSLPLSCKYRTTFPVTSVRNSEGSKMEGMRIVTPSMTRRNPKGSSIPKIL
mmetsp:Transcript_17316/g.42295  ORF Transcript_17316/g.42295 Transcript_17316/m.42295 type:complete len:219 (+) Transcript_17316:2567-3223(+)